MEISWTVVAGYRQKEEDVPNPTSIERCATSTAWPILANFVQKICEWKSCTSCWCRLFVIHFGIFSGWENPVTTRGWWLIRSLRIMTTTVTRDLLHDQSDTEATGDVRVNPCLHPSAWTSQPTNYRAIWQWTVVRSGSIKYPPVLSPRRKSLQNKCGVSYVSENYKCWRSWPFRW